MVRKITISRKVFAKRKTAENFAKGLRKKGSEARVFKLAPKHYKVEYR